MTSGALLAGSNLSKRFGGVTAVDNISLAIAPGELQCIIGPNGAGKSTLFNILGGVIRPDTGDIVFEGVPLHGLPLHGFARRGIARKFQIPSVFETLTVAQNLETAVIRPGSAAEHAQRLTAMLDLTGQTAIRHQVAGNLAHGHKQWLEIGMALMSEPRLLLLDEPTAGMTLDETLETAALVRRLAQTTAVMAIEHDMSFVRALGCHTIVMHQGRVIAEGTFSQIEEDALVRDIYLGRA